MNWKNVVLASALVACFAAGASAQSLNVGDDAPALTLSKTVKGEKIEKLEPDQTYVVEFWATWCGPCIANVPHLTELQHKYKDKGVKFLGVSIWEGEPAKVEPFVAKMGDQMDYTVAMDDLSDKKEGSKGKMADAWMTASESDGIPTSFIVRNGKVAWIGHPYYMEKHLVAALTTDFDLKAAADRAREDRSARKTYVETMAKIKELGPDADPKARLALIEKAIGSNPASEKRLGVEKYLILSGAGDAEASAYGNRLVASIVSDREQDLNMIAWANVDPESKLDKARRDIPLALKAAIKANELAEGKNGPILDTLAVATFESGDIKRGLELEEKADKLMGESNDDIKGRIEQYRKAIEAKAKP